MSIHTLESRSVEETRIASWSEWIQYIPKERRQQSGFKAQYAATVAIQEYLSAINTGWVFIATEVGSEEDRAGIDGYLHLPGTNAYYPIDFSLRDPEDNSGKKRNQVYLVHLRHAWFYAKDDGSWGMRRWSLKRLALAFLPALDAKPIHRRPVSLIDDHARPKSKTKSGSKRSKSTKGGHSEKAKRARRPQRRKINAWR